MKRKTKILISALSVMFVAAIAVAIASFSFAGNGDEDGLLENGEIIADASQNVDTKTIIDYIIDNSNSEDPEVDKIYHIAEISSSSASSLETFVSSNGFKDYVIDGNRTIEQAMADGCIEYKCFGGNVTSDADLAYISKADFIYVSNDSASKFTKDNDMSEKLYDLLHTYAVGDFKPLVIDSPNATTVDPSTSKNMKDLASSVFGPNEKYYYTFKWASNLSADQYLQHAGGSLYLGINGQTQKTNGAWTEVYESDPTASASDGSSAQPMSMAKILTIGVNTTYTKTDALLAGNPSATGLYAADGSVIADTATSKYYKLDANSIFYKNGYNNRVGVRPTYIQNDIVTLADSESVDFDQYDMIVIEDSCYNQTITADLYKKFASAMYGKLHIVYGADMGTSSDAAIKVPDDLKETNYSKLFYMVATTEYVARYENIMVTSRADFSVVTTSKSAATAKVIADLINASKYRGIGGRGSSSSSFTVLEIQPCYPIDEAVAQEVGKAKPRSGNASSIYGSGNYYTAPANVVNGKTKEQLAENTEYYAWELSKAKLADALNLPIDKINLVQMSSEEFACDKSEVLGKYDLVYIGGNTSALKDVLEYRSLTGLARWGGTLKSNSGSLDMSKITTLPIYTMYSHNGDIVNLDLSAMAQSPGPANSGTPTAKVRLNGNYTDTFTVLNGNDITYNRYEALKEYVDAGMPVVVSKNLTTAYTLAKTDGYLQNSIDPDSNMYKLLAACEGTDKDNVQWNFNQTDVEDILSDGSLGDSLTGYVSVFKGGAADTPKNELSSIYATSEKRPKLTITSMPATYNRYDETSQITDGTLKFKYTVTGSANYTVKLYIDDDGNSTFDRKEEYMTSGDANSLTYQCADSFYGPLYWMIEVVDTNGNSVSQTGIAYVKNKTDEKQQVNVLQIMPGGKANQWSNNALGEGAEGYNSLYFCTVCQQAYQRLEYNPYTNSGNRTAYGALYGGNFQDSKDGMLGSHYLGKHEHTFGIVSYDSQLVVPGKGVKGMDDWDNNLADQVNDLYDFDIDIMLRNEFEQAAKDAEAAYDYKVDNGEVDYSSAITDAEKEALVNSFTIDSTDTDYDKYNALTTVEDKYKFIKKREYEQLAGKYWQLYQFMKNESATGTSSMKDETGVDIQKTTVDARKELDEEIDKLIAGIQSGSTNSGKTTFSSNTSKETLIQELNRLKTKSTYSDYYSIDGNAAQYNDVSQAYLPNGESMNTYMEEYFKVKDKELEYKELYKKYTRYAAGADWLQESYSTIILGPSEDFGGDDITSPIALADLKSYIEDDGQLLLFHDTLTKFSDKGTSTLTATLRSYFGMDRYHFNDPVTTDASQNYVKYTTTQDSDKYFMTNLSTTKDESRYTSWLSDMKKVFGSTPSKYLTSVAYTDAVNVSGNDNPYAIPYRYADLSWAIAGYWYNAASFSAKENTKYGTDKASQNNQGIVTLFPFTLASELNISGTHSQAYALDVENDDMTVWYSLAGGNNTKDGSSIYAASPRDGMDNYFIYTYKNVNYCGAGHSKVTGVGKDNNDERYLYINIICNSVRNSVKQPTIYVYDYGKETNNIIKRDVNDDYYTKVEENTSYPEFSFKVTVDQDATLKQVRIYYDLDYSETNRDSSYVADKNHVLIADWNSTQVKEGIIKDVFRYDSSLEKLLNKDGGQIAEKYVDSDGKEVTVAATKLKLQPSYFENYNNEYTYIVIEATDSEGNKVYQRIKVMLKDYLFDLT